MKTDLGILLVLGVFLLTVQAPIDRRTNHAPAGSTTNRVDLTTLAVRPGEHRRLAEPAPLGTLWCHMLEVALLPRTPGESRPSR